MYTEVYPTEEKLVSQTSMSVHRIWWDIFADFKFLPVITEEITQQPARKSGNYGSLCVYTEINHRSGVHNSLISFAFQNRFIHNC